MRAVGEICERETGHATGTYILCSWPLPHVRLDADLRRGDTEVQSILQVDQAKLVLGMVAAGVLGTGRYMLEAPMTGDGTASLLLHRRLEQ